MRVQLILLFSIVLFCGCIGEEKNVLEYQCWDGTIVSDLIDCPPTTSIKQTTSTTTSTSTTQLCQWTEGTCRMYCSKECGIKPLEHCQLNETTCICAFRCGVTSTTTTSTTSTTLKRWLSEKEIDESMVFGEENRFNLSGLLSTYAYPNYTVGYEHVIIYTPSLNLALSAASNAREYRKLSDSEIDAFVEDEKIMFRVKLYGNSQDFADNIKAVIKLRNKIIHPVKTIPDNSPETTAYWPDSPPYFAVNTYIFKDYGQIADRVIRFTVIKYTGEDEYTINMADYI